MSCEKEKKEGEATEEQIKGKDVQDPMCPMRPSLFGRRRDLGSEGHPDLRKVWRDPVGARTMAAVAPTSWDSDTVRHRVGLSGTPCFRQEYLGKFPEQVMAEVIAEGLWARYHLACEKFDQVVCSGRQGVAIPLRGDEYRMISSHAAGRRRYLVETARSMGISRDQLAVSGRAVNRELMSSWNYLVEETMKALIQRMNDVLAAAHE